jgi:putative ABC transport system permease protein
MRIGWGKFIIGAVLLAISIFMNSKSEEWVNYLSGILILVSVVGLVLMYPKVIDLITNLLFNVFRGKSKVIVLALNNLRTSKVLMGNITLIVISMLSIFMITSIGTSLKDLVAGVYEDMKFDVSVSGIRGVQGQEDDFLTNKLISKIKENESVEKDSIQISREKAVTINNNTMAELEGIECEKYQNSNKYLEFDSDKYNDMYKKFEKSSAGEVIISDKLKKHLNVEVGDKITVNLNDIQKDLKVIGTFDGKLYQSGQIIFMKNDDMKKQFNVKEASVILFETTKSPDEVKEELKSVIKKFGAVATTNDESKEQNLEANQQIVNVLSLFSYLAILIAALGVLNNIIIGFLQRKRELAVLSSVGMSDGARNGMLLTESILSVVWAIVIAIPYSYLGLSLLTKTMTAIEMPMEVVLDINAVPVYVVVALVLILLASLPILLKSKKLSIIDELKYE